MRNPQPRRRRACSPPPPHHRRRGQSAAGVSKDTRVLDLCAEHHGLTAAEAGHHMGDSTPTVYSRLQRLVREGKLTVGADKKYRRVIESAA